MNIPAGGFPDKPADVAARDADILARTLWGEARGEGIVGMDAVACVIRNRVNIAGARAAKLKNKTGKPYSHPLFGDGSYASACRKPRQFSCWNENDPNRTKLAEVDEKDKSFRAALTVAAMTIDGSTVDPTAGATHYCTVDITPYWAAAMTETAVIGKHRFYK